MQQNTRLVIITLEVVRGMGLQTAVPLLQPRNVGSDEDDDDAGADGEDPASSEGAAGAASGGSGGSSAYVPGFVLACDPGAVQWVPPSCGVHTTLSPVWLRGAALCMEGRQATLQCPPSPPLTALP